MGPPGWFRLMRAGTFASVCVVLSLAGHDLMAARPAPLWAGGAALTVLTAGGHLAAGRRRPAWAILLAVEAAQLCLHLWFAWCTEAAAPAGPMAAHAVPGSMPMGTGAPMPAHLPHMPMGPSMNDGLLPGPGMAAAHALAGLAVALWLAVGERALWRALGVLAGFLLGPTLRAFALLTRRGHVLDRYPPLPGRRDDDRSPPPTAVLRHVLVRRGPPRAAGVPANAHM